MATYFHVNSEIQVSDGSMQTLYLMNPNYIPNSNTLLSNPVNLSHAPPPPPQQHLSWGSSDTHMASLAAAAAGNSAPSSVSVVSSGISSMQSVILGSYKYLRPAQELLDEVVKVVEDEFKEKMKLNREPKTAAVDHHQEQNGKSPLELTTAQRQDLQIKKAKLVNMLDEVEQRYTQYHHQMQSVVTAFEHAAGFGSAKTYTAVALRTISQQFRCLKDAISAQLKATSKKLGEDDSLGAKLIGSSKLRFAQQLGMMQHHSWRAQRGLPERAVTILRAWLFEHFLHPYPKDSDKQHLAKQTGLTRSQVSNWFINARVRLWKPMVEEMYLEEVKEKEGNGSQSKESTHQLEQIKALQDCKAEKSTEFSNSIISASPMGATLQQQTSFNLVGPSDLERFNPDHHHQLAAPTFHGNNGVSLSLGLPYCELGSTEPDFCPESSGYGSIEIDHRKRFAAQLLPADFMTS